MFIGKISKFWGIPQEIRPTHLAYFSRKPACLRLFAILIALTAGRGIWELALKRKTAFKPSRKQRFSRLEDATSVSVFHLAIFSSRYRAADYAHECIKTRLPAILLDSNGYYVTPFPSPWFPPPPPPQFSSMFNVGGIAWKLPTQEELSRDWMIAIFFVNVCFMGAGERMKVQFSSTVIFVLSGIMVQLGRCCAVLLSYVTNGLV